MFIKILGPDISEILKSISIFKSPLHLAIMPEKLFAAFQT